LQIVYKETRSDELIAYLKPQLHFFVQHIFVARWEIDAIFHSERHNVFVAGCPFLGLRAMGYIVSIEDILGPHFINSLQWRNVDVSYH
jgi:hypothetical protein